MLVEATVFNLMQIGEPAKVSLSDEGKGTAYCHPMAAAVWHAQPHCARVCGRQYEHCPGHDPDGSCPNCWRSSRVSRAKIKSGTNPQAERAHSACGFVLSRKQADTAEPAGAVGVYLNPTTPNGQNLQFRPPGLKSGKAPHCGALWAGGGRLRPSPFILVLKWNTPNRGETGPNGAVFWLGGALARPPPEPVTQGAHGADGVLTAGPDWGPGGAAVPPPGTGPGNPPTPYRSAPGSRRPSFPAARPAPAWPADTGRRTHCCLRTPG